MYATHIHLYIYVIEECLIASSTYIYIFIVYIWCNNIGHEYIYIYV